MATCQAFSPTLHGAHHESKHNPPALKSTLQNTSCLCTSRLNNMSGGTPLLRPSLAHQSTHQHHTILIQIESALKQGPLSLCPMAQIIYPCDLFNNSSITQFELWPATFDARAAQDFRHNIHLKQFKYHLCHFAFYYISK
jgi:hypothetical protein